MTKTIEDYLNDPDIANEPIALKEVHAARFMIQDETRGMTKEERTTYYNENAKAFFSRLGITPKYISL
jgi:hypothetical protein